MNCKFISTNLLGFLIGLSILANVFALENDRFILDTVDDTANWDLSPIYNRNKWFKYFYDTNQLTDNNTANYGRSCAEIISNRSNYLDQVNGIWVSCHNSTAQYAEFPVIHFPKRNVNRSIHSISIRIAFLGFATLRFNLGRFFCIDYSARWDPWSRCQFIQIVSQLEWVDVDITADNSINFRTFSVQLFPRFEGDAVLIDKIQAINYLPCDDDTINPCNSTGSDTSAYIIPSSSFVSLSVLDIESDATLPTEYTWELPDKLPKWMEYYTDYEKFLGQTSNSSTCANLISTEFINRNLPNVAGIWSSCQKGIECESNPSSCHPSIYYKPPDNHYVSLIKSKFHLQNTARVKLHAGDKCWDFEFENDTISSCIFVRIPQLGDRWLDFAWTSQIFLPNQRAMDFTLELITQSNTDVILLDIIEVEYQKCVTIDQCSPQPTNPPELSSTTDIGTTEEETSTICDSSTTTEEFDSTDSIEASTTTDSEGTICTTNITSTTTRRSGSSTRAVINMITFMVVILVISFVN